MQDYYKTLGVSRNATADEIRKAYKKIARENHPDVKPDDKAASERFKQAAEDINELPQVGRDVFPVVAEVPFKHVDQKPPDVDLKEVLLALKDVLHRADMFSSHHIAREPLSLRERMSRVLESVTTDRFTQFTDLFDISEGRQGVVVTFMAILELIKQQLVELVQAESYAPIHVRARGG